MIEVNNNEKLLALKGVVQSIKDGMPVNFELSMELIVAIGIITVGAVFLFFGIRLFKPIIITSGFMFCATVSLFIMDHFDAASKMGENGTKIYYVILLISGIVGGLLANYLWKCGVAMLGTMAGFAIGNMVLAFFPGIAAKAISSVWGRWAITLVAAGIGGVLASTRLFEKVIIIGCTSLLGTFGAGIGADILGGYGLRAAIKQILLVENDTWSAKLKGLSKSSLKEHFEESLHPLLAVMFAAFVIGVLVQYFITGRNSKGYSAVANRNKKDDFVI